jgi:oxygen-independent coproporphyrinogen III oxidase
MMVNPFETYAGVYFHIPYCKKACHYCNFHFSTSLQSKNDMVLALLREIDITRGKNRRLITSVYFGGGTPSVLLRKELRALMESIRKSFKLLPDAEFTYEVNPDDMNEMTVPFWKQQGFNRLSIGIQSFRDEDLVWMNRSHTSQQALEGLELVRNAGFTNYSIDLIYGIPGLSDEAWKNNIEKAISLNIPHISAYALTVEPRTALNTMIDQGKKESVDPEQQARQFMILMDMMESAGYEHYEISNFAKPGFRSKHNSSYWQGIPYFGFGPGAHSYDGYTRYWNVSNNARYIDSLNSNNIIPFDKEDLTETMQINEYIMTSLRTMEGIDLVYLAGKWGVDKAETLKKESFSHASRGMILYNDEHIVLTREGKLFADGIASDLFFTDKDIEVESSKQ